MCGMQPEEIVDLWYGPGPFRQTVENWADVVRAGVATLRREASRSADPKLLELVRRAEAHLRTMPQPSAEAEPELPFVCARMKPAGRIVRTVSTVMRLSSRSTSPLPSCASRCSFQPMRQVMPSF